LKQRPRRGGPGYLVWHPLDHISYEVERPRPDGHIGPGTKLHIVEALGRDPATIVWLENEFHAEPRGARYVTRMTLG
jgi:hypothetical protein